MLSKREKVLVAVLGSILAHLLILLLFGIGLHFTPQTQAVASDRPIQLEIKPPEDEPPVLPPMPLAATPPPPMVNNKESDEPPPPDASFQSNANSKGASEQPATGTAPVPTQEGKQVPEYTFQNQETILGARPAETASDPARSQPPQQQTPPPETPAPPQETPAPRPRKDRKPPANPAPTPEPLIERDEFAMLGPTPTPHPVPKEEDNNFNPSLRSPVTEPPRPTPAVRRPPAQQQPPPPQQQQPPSRPSNPGYQPMTKKAAMSGGISNKGPSSVAALGTPLGRYQKAVNDAIGSRWNLLIEQRQDVVSLGTARIHFFIERSGAVLQPEMVSNSGNSTYGGVCMESVTDAEIPPIPPDVAALLDSNRIELVFSFDLVTY